MKKTGKDHRPDKRPMAIIYAGLVLLLLAMFTVALCAGRYALKPNDAFRILFSKLFGLEKSWEDTQENVVMLLRLPRICAAILVGAALALSGATYQGIFKNPLVSPDLLGVSGGACVGAAVSILLGLGTVFTQLFAFFGGVAAVAVTTLIPRLMRRRSTVMLVLSGVIVSGFMSSVIGLIKYIADTETQLPDIVYWQLGSLAKVTYRNIISVGPVMVIAAVVLLAMRWRINLLSLGDRDAQMLGVNLKKERGVAIVCATVLTSCAICMAGTIGWLGLVMPHVGRKLVGSDNTRLLPVSALLSACFLLLIDTIARTLTGAELPIGIFTGFLGAPFFALLLVRERSVD